MKNIDAKGKACPIPVIMAKKEADSGNSAFSVIVDNQTAVENLSRFGSNGGFQVKVREISPEEFVVSLSKGGAGEISSPQAEAAAETGKTWAVFIGKKGIGEGDEEFSSTLMNMYLYTLTEADNIPDYILFMNKGVTIPTENEDASEHLKKLIKRGCKVLVCGACLNYYGLEKSLKAGEVSNMYSINEAMTEVDKVISL